MVKYDVFLSFKNTDENNNKTPDYAMAKALYEVLKKKGISVFFSPESIHRQGDPDYIELIDEAIEQSCIFVAVATSLKHLESRWVKREIKRFDAETANGNKPEGSYAILSYITKDVPHTKMHMALRNNQFYYDLEPTAEFIESSLRNIKSTGVRIQQDMLLENTRVLEIGSVLAQYKILSLVGRGGMSEVYLAIDEKANKMVAVKAISNRTAKNFEIVRAGLRAETDLLRRMDHPAIPKIHDVVDTGDRVIIVMDYVGGNSLQKSLNESGPLSEKQVVEVSQQLCGVMHYLHTQQPPVIYRDLKPANIMLNPSGSIKLIDFGIAREYKVDNLGDTTCLGTIGYAAPEQFGGMGQSDPRTDIYSLGVTIHHLVTGKNPSEPPYETLPIRQINPELSRGLEYIIQKCTQRDPDKRYQSMEEVRKALDSIDKLSAKLKRSNLLWDLLGVTKVSKQEKNAKQKTKQTKAPAKSAAPATPGQPAGRPSQNAQPVIPPAPKQPQFAIPGSPPPMPAFKQTNPVTSMLGSPKPVTRSRPAPFPIPPAAQPVKQAPKPLFDENPTGFPWRNSYGVTVMPKKDSSATAYEFLEHRSKEMNTNWNQSGVCLCICGNKQVIAGQSEPVLQMALFSQQDTEQVVAYLPRTRCYAFTDVFTVDPMDMISVSMACNASQRNVRSEFIWLGQLSKREIPVKQLHLPEQITVTVKRNGKPVAETTLVWRENL